MRGSPKRGKERQGGQGKSKRGESEAREQPKQSKTTTITTTTTATYLFTRYSTIRQHTLTMSSLQEWFALSPAFGVAICHEHGVAITAKSVASHVKLYHRHVATQARQRIVEEAAAL